MGWPGKVSSATSVISFSEPCSIPLAQRMIGVGGWIWAARALKVARICWAGGTARIRSQVASSAKSDRAVMLEASVTPGRKRGFS